MDNLEQKYHILKTLFNEFVGDVKNDNFNFISDSGLKTGEQIYAVGDSHAIFFYKSKKIIAMWGGLTSEYPLTIYKLIRTNLNALDIPSVIGRGHERYKIKENDYVLFYYGYNDIQKHIAKYEKWQEQIVVLCENYVKLMILYRTACKINPIISFVYPIPKRNSNAHVNGSESQRIEYTIYMNSVLKKLCSANGIRFFDIYDYIVNESGYIKDELCNDGMHLDLQSYSLRTYVEEKILELCK
jgi:lysophospholipase L1-like esterase